MRVFKRSKTNTAYDSKLAKYIKNIFGFKPGNIFLYELAFLHKSKAVEIKKGIRKSNERLEYLGDAILGAIVADYIFKKFPYEEEGFLTEMRSKIVSRENLNKLSKKLGFTNFIRQDKYVCSPHNSIDGDAFEAFIGAIYLDKGYTFTKNIVIKRIINCHLDIEELRQTEANYKSRIIEWAQKVKKEVEFKVVDEIGNGYGKYYIVDLYVESDKIATGKDHSIKKAEQIAAKNAFQKIFPG